MVVVGTCYDKFINQVSIMLKKIFGYANSLMVVALILVSMFAYSKTNQVKQLEETVERNKQVVKALNESLETETRLKELAQLHQSVLEKTLETVSTKTQDSKQKVTQLTVEQTDKGIEIDLAWDLFEELTK